MVKEKYGFRVGEKVLYTSTVDGYTEICIVKSFDVFGKDGIVFFEGGWDTPDHFTKLQPCEGNQLLFDFMRD
jgi:hypothetical protein